MSYAVQIQRPNGLIPYGEWLAVARTDPELVEVGHSEWLRPDGGTETFVVFTWQPPITSGDDHPATAEFVYYNGRIAIDHVEDHWMKKIAALAAGLDAIATGDDGETYDLDGRAHRPSPQHKSGWLRKLFG